MTTKSFQCLGCGKIHEGIPDKLDGKKIRCECGMMTRVHFSIKELIEPIKIPRPLLPPAPKPDPKPRQVTTSPTLPPGPAVRAPIVKTELGRPSVVPNRHVVTVVLAIISGALAAVFGLVVMLLGLSQIAEMSSVYAYARELPGGAAETNKTFLILVSYGLVMVSGLAMQVFGGCQLINSFWELLRMQVRHSWPDISAITCAASVVLISVYVMVWSNESFQSVVELIESQQAVTPRARAILNTAKTQPVLMASRLAHVLIIPVLVIAFSTTRLVDRLVTRATHR